MDATAGNRISMHLRRRTVAIALFRGWKAHRAAAVTPLLLRKRSRRQLLSGAGIAALLVAATLSPSLVTPARADTSWTGAADTDWHNAANWTNGVPSNTGNDAYITGPVAPVISGAASGENWTWVGYGSGNSGAITIGDGGSLTAGCCFYLGANHGTGSMTVTGTGSFTASNILMLGDYNSTGYLTIENGGTVNSGFLTYVGRASGSSGYATVTGENSLWSVSASSLRIAGESANDSAYGSVTLSDAGVLRVNGGSGSVIIGNSSNSTAFLNIGAAEGDTAAAAGTVDAGSVVLGSGDGTLVFNHTDTGLDFSASITGTGEVRQLAGATILSGANTWSGSTVVEGGVLRAGGASGLSGNATYEVNGGTLDLNDFDLTMSSLAGTGGTVDLGSAALTVGSGNTDTAFAGAISGTGNLVKLGSGILTLTGANTYTGGTTVSGGTLQGTSSSLAGDIVNDAALVFAQAGDGTYAGAVSGTGSLEKTGAGMLTLTGANGYTGGTTVSGGTLAGDTSSLQGDIVNNAGLLFDQSADGTYAGVLSGSGDIVKSGAGSLVLSGISSAFTGGLEVLSGSLVVDGTFGGGLLVSGGFLGGSGTVGSTTLGGGATLAAGNSIGTFTVAGDLAFSAGSVLAVEVNDGGDAAGVNADFVHVTGAATIASGAVVEVAPANGTDDGITYAPSTTYRILTADGGIGGVFDGVTANFAFLMPELSYDANNVFLTLSQMAAFEDAASTPNQQGVATATEALGSGNPLYDEIIGMSEEEAQAAFDALSGEAHASSTGGFSGSAGIVRRTIFSRLFSRFGAPRGFAAAEGYVPAAGDETPHGYTLWGELVRGWGETDGSVSVAGIERNSTGFLGGVDREIGEVSRIGIAPGYSHATFDVSGRSSAGKSDNFHVAGYAGTELGPVDLKCGLGYSYQMAESRRRVVVGGVADNLSADYGAHTFQASGEASLDLETGLVTLTPFAGLAVVHVETEAFTETGGPSALSIASSGNTTGISELGLRAAREAGSLTLFGSASWRHVFGDVEPLSRASFASSPATTFSVRGTPLSEDVASIGGGIELLIAEETTLEFSYRGEFASDSRDHGLKAKLRIDF